MSKKYKLVPKKGGGVAFMIDADFVNVSPSGAIMFYSDGIATEGWSPGNWYSFKLEPESEPTND